MHGHSAHSQPESGLPQRGLYRWSAAECPGPCSLHPPWRWAGKVELTVQQTRSNPVRPLGEPTSSICWQERGNPSTVIVLPNHVWHTEEWGPSERDMGLWGTVPQARSRWTQHSSVQDNVARGRESGGARFRSWQNRWGGGSIGVGCPPRRDPEQSSLHEPQH